jgi:hypothetical protein
MLIHRQVTMTGKIVLLLGSERVTGNKSSQF